MSLIGAEKWLHKIEKFTDDLTILKSYSRDEYLAEEYVKMKIAGTSFARKSCFETLYINKWSGCVEERDTALHVPLYCYQL